MVGQAAREQHRRVHRTNPVARFHAVRIQPAIVIVDVHAVVDGGDFPVWHFVHPHDLFLQSVGNSDDSIGPVRGSPFLVADARATAPVKMIAAASIFSGMNGENALPPSPLFDPDHRVGCQPVVSVDDVKGADEIFSLEDIMDERATHVIHFFHEVRVQGEWTPMIVDPVDPPIVVLAVSQAREHMHFMTFPLQSGGQLRGVRTHASYRDRMERLPSE